MIVPTDATASARQPGVFAHRTISASFRSGRATGDATPLGLGGMGA